MSLKSMIDSDREASMKFDNLDLSVRPPLSVCVMLEHSPVPAHLTFTPLSLTLSTFSHTVGTLGERDALGTGGAGV